MNEVFAKTTFAAGIVAASLTASPLRAQTVSPMLTGTVSLADVAIKGPGRLVGRFVKPDSSRESPADVGRRMHTHYQVFVPAPGSQPASSAATSPAAGLPPYSGYYTETPASLACVYEQVTPTNGCDPNKVTAYSHGGAKAIALVDAYDLPTAASDLAYYSQQFGLPAATFSVVYASGSKPSYNSGWALEAGLDIEMAHAMAPSARIYLVEAKSASSADLDVAVDKAYALVRAAGGGEVSMSYGGSEYSGVTSENAHFNKTGVLFFASTGDAPGVEFPSSSPNVIAVGGTSISREMLRPTTFGRYLEETAWWNAGGGASQYFAQPTYQAKIGSRFGVKARLVPDIGAVASEASPVWVYQNGSWYFVNGTSVASPLSAGIANKVGPSSLSPTTELSYLYSRAGTASSFDVTLGVCGPNAGYFASARTSSNPILAYDLCTGVGTPRGASAF